MNNKLLFIPLLLTCIFLGINNTVYAAHEPVELLDASGQPVGGTSNPYSPKTTCGLVDCHNNTIASANGLDNIYESHWNTVSKSQWNRDGLERSHNVPYPEHGVTAGWHFHQGRNVSWDEFQRQHYGLPKFTSSPGMYGGYEPPNSLQLVSPNEDNLNTWGESSFDWARGECGWCHPGGGSLEYDREGYRYDGSFSPYADLNNDGTSYGPFTGFNSLRNDRPGDYFSFDPNDPNLLVNKTTEWVNQGTVEADCLMCHYANQYNNNVRNYCMSDYGPDSSVISAHAAATFGLVGARGQTGLVNTSNKGNTGSSGGNPTCDILGYNNLGDGVGILPGSLIVTTPKKEACAVCHFDDKSWAEQGPGDANLGHTAFQKYIDQNSFFDSDTNTLNADPYQIAKPRPELGKRGESINDPHNKEYHMDLGMVCADCHYLLGGKRDSNNQYNPQTFPARLDREGNLLQPEMTVLGIDHQFAKGDTTPDGKLLDQLDNTLTCETCHINMTHPNIIDNGNGTYSFQTAYAGTRSLPLPTHAPFPVAMLEKLDCRICHIHEQNGSLKEIAVDYYTTKYPMDANAGVNRGQVLESPTGIHYTPLRIWGCRDHNCEPSEMQLRPVTTTTTWFWKNLADNQTYARRFPQEAIQILRKVMSETNSAPFPWTLNSPQGGDTGLIINTTTEISSMVDILQGTDLGFGILNQEAQILEPALNVFLNKYTTTLNGALGKPLGSNGCTDCHSETAGFFDRQHLLFNQPNDSGMGMQMTCDGDDCLSGTKRITANFKFPCPDGSIATVDLTEGKHHEESIANSISQADVLCFSDSFLNTLKIGKSSLYLVNFRASFSATQRESSNPLDTRFVDFDASSSECGVYHCVNGLCNGGASNDSACTSDIDCPATCSYKWDFENDGIVDATGVTTANQYPDTEIYTAKLTITDPGTGYFKSTTKLVAGAAVVTPTYPTLTGVDSTDASGTASLTIVSNGYTVLGSYIDWRDKKTQRVKTLGPHNHTYAFVGTGMTYSAKVRVTYIDHLDGNRVKNKFVIQPLYVE